jgi:DNA-binding NarL/FixJ family response regulator
MGIGSVRRVLIGVWGGTLESNVAVRVVIADGHSLFREAMKTVLQSEADLEVVGEARDGIQAVAEIQRTSADVALIDAGLPNCDGIRATALIKESVPNCQVLVVSGEEDHTTLADAVEAGASGYLSKEYPLAELIEATRAIHRGETLIPQSMLGTLLRRLINRRRERDDALKRTQALTRREKEVLALLAEGADNDAIAQYLVISPQTARTHIQNVLGKLKVHSRLEAAAFVTQNGLLAELAGADR